MITETQGGPMTLREASLVVEEKIDVLGVVSSISVDVYQGRASVLIVDPSIATGLYARVTFRGSSSAARLADVSTADAIQLHGVFVQKGSGSVLCELQHHWEHPNAAPPWTQLSQGGRISDMGMRAASVTTSIRKVQELLDWYNSADQINTGLPSLPCRRRRLREVHCAGVHSHVVVSVLSVDTNLETKANRGKPKMATTLATLSDETNVVVPLVHCCRFKQSLLLAMGCGNQVLITNVVSVRTTDDDCPGLSEVVLMPNANTTITAAIRDTSSITRGRLELPFLSLTQNLEDSRYRRTFVSPLKDVYIESIGVSLAEGLHFRSPTLFTTVIAEATHPPYYRAATLTLDESVAHDCFVVGADGRVVQKLCGSLDVDTLVHESRSRRYAMELLMSLFSELTSLSWTVERAREDEQYRVTNVSLANL